MKKKILESRPLSKQDLFELIEQITPLNNKFRDLSKVDQNGTEVLFLMWNIGEVIRLFVKKYEIKPHALYWRIYGKAEGLRTSYITRDFLSYCLRINRYFKNRNEISHKFPSLRKYSLFREAFPLLENEKFKISDDEKDRITKMLNSNEPPQKIRQALKQIKSRRIGIKNTRMQKLGEMKPITDNFVLAYNDVYALIKKNDRSSVEKFTISLGRDFLIKLSQAVSALTQENLYIPELEEGGDLPKLWNEFVKNTRYLLAATVVIRNRFRRLVPPKKLFELADMLDAFAIDGGILNYRKRKNLVG
jgi:hypothetical protein